MLEHQADPKYWQINVRGEDIYTKLWRHAGGRALLKAIGFGEPMETSTPGAAVNPLFASLKALATKATAKVAKLPADLVLSLRSRQTEIGQELKALEGAPSVAAAIREMRVHHNVAEVRGGAETALTIVRNILMQPKDLRMYRVKKTNPAFHRHLGRLKGSEQLMHAIGFHGGSEGGEEIAGGTLSSTALSATGGTGKGGKENTLTASVTFNLPDSLGGTMATTASAAKPAGAAYVLKSVSKKPFDPAGSLPAGADPTNFKFQYLDPETEKFLWRRKADLEVALRALDGMDAMGGPAGTGSSSAFAATDAAHTMGTTANSLAHKAALAKAGDKTAKLAGKAAAGGKAGAGKAAPGKAPADAAGKGKAASQAQLGEYTRGATAAQQAQVKMIAQVFEAMDADGDGALSVADVRAYFRTVGRPAEEAVVRQWVASRDVDQDGVVGLGEFVASYAKQLDPASKGTPAPGQPAGAKPVSAVASAFGALCLGNSLPEARAACTAAAGYLRRVLDEPAVQAYWRINVHDTAFASAVGRLFGGVPLMHALGFEGEQNGTVLALRDPTGRVWTSLPAEARVQLRTRLDELLSHMHALDEPSISNVAAVSAAVGALGDTHERAVDWLVAVETIHTIVGNVVKHPGDPKYYQVNIANPAFSRRMGKVRGCVQIVCHMPHVFPI